MKNLIAIFLILFAGWAPAQSYLIPSAMMIRQIHEPAGLEISSLDRFTGGLTYWRLMRPGSISLEAFYNRNAQQIRLPGEVRIETEWEYLTTAAAFRFRLPVPDPDAGEVTVGPVLYASYLLDAAGAPNRFDGGAGAALAFRTSILFEVTYLHGLLGLSETTRNQQLIFRFGIPIGL